MKPIYITTVSSHVIDDEFPTAELTIVHTNVTSTSDLYHSISHPDFYADIIILDLADFATTNDKFSTISTISNLLSTYKRPAEHKPAIAVLAHTAVNIKGLKEVMCADVKGIYPCGAEFSFEEKALALSDLLSNPIQHIPAKFRKLFKRASTRVKPTRDQLILTPRQSQVLALIQHHGASNKVIARMLNISESMVKSHVTRLLCKYGLKNRTQLALYKQTK